MDNSNDNSTTIRVKEKDDITGYPSNFQNILKSRTFSGGESEFNGFGFLHIVPNFELGFVICGSLEVTEGVLETLFSGLLFCGLLIELHPFTGFVSAVVGLMRGNTH